MGYSNGLYMRASAVLNMRRRAAISEREKRIEEVRSNYPELLRIESEMAKSGLEAAKVMLSGGDIKKKIDELSMESRALRLEREELLRIAGLPADYLDYHFTCPECEDTGFKDGKICRCHLELLKGLMYDDINSRAPLASSTFETFELNYYPTESDASGIPIRTKMNLVKQRCIDYAESFDKKAPSLFMYGETGLGKTHLSLAIANRVLDLGYGVEYGSAQNIFSNLEREHFSRDEGQKGRYESVLLNSDLLIVDDLGAEFVTSFTVACLYNIVNTRMLAGKPVIINTNVTAEELEDKYTRRITSRIFGSYELIGFAGRDIRQLKKLER